MKSALITVETKDKKNYNVVIKSAKFTILAEAERLDSKIWNKSWDIKSITYPKGRNLTPEEIVSLQSLINLGLNNIGNKKKIVLKGSIL